MTLKGHTYRHRKDVNGKPPETRERPCLRCRKPFDSEGAHHRLCNACRAVEVSPFAV